MPTLLARNADVLVTMDGGRRELKNAGLYAENGKIQKYKLRERGITPGTWDREAAGIVVKRR